MHMWNMGEGPYWDARYSKEKFRDIEWYCSYDVMKKHGLFAFGGTSLSEDSCVLMLGCGNSRVSIDMYGDGIKNVTNIDVSTVVIDHMRSNYADYDMRWMAMDAAEMGVFKEGQFDYVIDKGTLDAVCCGPSGGKNAIAVCAEVRRVLNPGGLYVCMSYAPPYMRDRYLMAGNPCWELAVRKVTLEAEDTTKCLSVLEGEAPQFYVYYLTRTEHPTALPDSAPSGEPVFLENPAFINKPKT